MDNKNDDFNSLFSNIYETKKYGNKYEQAMSSSEESQNQPENSVKSDVVLNEKNDQNQDSGKKKVIVGSIIAIILMSIWSYYKQRKCPNCKKFKLEQKDTLLLIDDKKVRVTETFFLCKNCAL